MVISGGHTIIQKSEITGDLLVGWKDPTIPISQRRLTEAQLKEMYSGQVNELFIILEKCVRESCNPDSTILELGCSTGYYYEILTHLLQTKITYTGVDYSEAMVEAARKYYPDAAFVVADGANLPFKNNQFSVVISGSILIHNLNYHKHINETARVSNSRVIIHRTQLCKSRPTHFLKKKAYDIDVLEVRFNESELLELFEKERFYLLHTYEYLTDNSKDEFESTHLLKRK